MLTDWSYNVELQDWDFADGDFVVTPDASVQNGGLILLFRAFISANPILGIGIYQLRGDNVTQVNYEMNRWKQQVIDDGGRAAVTTTLVNGNQQFSWQVNYD